MSRPYKGNRTQACHRYMTSDSWLKLSTTYRDAFTGTWRLIRDWSYLVSPRIWRTTPPRSLAQPLPVLSRTCVNSAQTDDTVHMSERKRDLFDYIIIQTYDVGLHSQWGDIPCFRPNPRCTFMSKSDHDSTIYEVWGCCFFLALCSWLVGVSFLLCAVV